MKSPITYYPFSGKGIHDMSTTYLDSATESRDQLELSSVGEIVYLKEIIDAASAEIAFDDQCTLSGATQSMQDTLLIETIPEKSGLRPRLPLVKNPVSSPERNFRLLQHWEGVVDEVGEDTFWATLSDLTNPENPEEFAELPLSEITPADLVILKPGGIFYWSIGYDTSPAGTRSRVSRIQLKRNPIWTRRAIENLGSEAERLATLLRGQNESQSTCEQ